MEDLVKALENENCNIELYLHKINALSDEEIVDLFNKVNISESLKNKLFVVASERINNLSTSSFIEISTWASSVEEYKKHYFSKIEGMSYEEIVNLIYYGIYEPDIIVAITETNVYKQYRTGKKRTKKKRLTML